MKDPDSAVFQPRYQLNYRVTAIFGNNHIEVQDEKGHKSIRRSAHVKVIDPAEKVVQQLPTREVLKQYGRSAKLILQAKDIPDLQFDIVEQEEMNNIETNTLSVGSPLKTKSDVKQLTQSQNSLSLEEKVTTNDRKNEKTIILCKGHRESNKCDEYSTHSPSQHITPKGKVCRGENWRSQHHPRINSYHSGESDEHSSPSNNVDTTSTTTANTMVRTTCRCPNARKDLNCDGESLTPSSSISVTSATPQTPMEWKAGTCLDVKKSPTCESECDETLPHSPRNDELSQHSPRRENKSNGNTVSVPGLSWFGTQIAQFVKINAQSCKVEGSQQVTNTLNPCNYKTNTQVQSEFSFFL